MEKRMMNDVIILYISCMYGLIKNRDKKIASLSFFGLMIYRSMVNPVIRDFLKF